MRGAALGYSITLRVGRKEHEVSGLAVSERMEIIKVWRLDGWPKDRKLPAVGARVSVVNSKNVVTLEIVVCRVRWARGQVVIEGRRVVE